MSVIRSTGGQGPRQVALTNADVDGYLLDSNEPFERRRPLTFLSDHDEALIEKGLGCMSVERLQSIYNFFALASVGHDFIQTSSCTDGCNYFVMI